MRGKAPQSTLLLRVAFAAAAGIGIIGCVSSVPRSRSATTAHGSAAAHSCSPERCLSATGHGSDWSAAAAGARAELVSSISSSVRSMSTRLFEQVRRGSGDEEEEELSFLERTMRKTVVSARFSHNELIRVKTAPPAPDGQVGAMAWLDRAEALAILGSERERSTRALRSEISALEAAVAHKDLSIALRAASREELLRQAAEGDRLALQMATIAGVQRGAPAASASFPAKLPPADLLARLATSIASLRRLKDATPWTVSVRGATRSCPSRTAKERISSLLARKGLKVVKKGRRARSRRPARGSVMVLDLALELGSSRSSEGYAVARAGAALDARAGRTGPAIISVAVPKEKHRWASKEPISAQRAACSSLLADLTSRFDEELDALLGLYSSQRKGVEGTSRTSRALHEAVPSLTLAGPHEVGGPRCSSVVRKLRSSIEKALVSGGRFSLAPAARRVLHGTLTGAPSGVAVDLRITALASGSIEESAATTCGTREEEIVECARWLAAKLSGLPLPRPPVAISNRGQQFAIAPPILGSSSIFRLDPHEIHTLVEQWLLGHGLRVARPMGRAGAKGAGAAAATAGRGDRMASSSGPGASAGGAAMSAARGSHAVLITTRVRGHDLGQVRKSSFRSVRCDIDLAALHDGEKIASASGSAARAHLDTQVAFREAAQVAVAAAMARLLPSIESAGRARSREDQKR